jgi:hypothetical protein
MEEKTTKKEGQISEAGDISCKRASLRGRPDRARVVLE